MDSGCLIFLKYLMIIKNVYIYVRKCNLIRFTEGGYMKILCLKVTEEVFHTSIIPTVAPSRHTYLHINYIDEMYTGILDHYTKDY